MKKFLRPPTMTPDGEGFVTVSFPPVDGDRAIEIARYGFNPGRVVVVDKWEPKIFLATSIMAAYEVAYGFSEDGHHDRQPLVILSVKRSLVPGKLRPDPHVPLERKWHRGMTVPVEDGMRLRRKRRGSVMTDTTIPASAIAVLSSVPRILLEKAAFRRWMGITK